MLLPLSFEQRVWLKCRRLSGCLSWEEVLDSARSSVAQIISGIDGHGTILEAACKYLLVRVQMIEAQVACQCIVRTDLLHDWMLHRETREAVDDYLMSLSCDEN